MKKTVLIVDDEPNNLSLMKVTLSEDNYTLKFAKNGAKALETAAKEQPDLILLDVMMPGMDGYEVCHRLKSSSETAGIPIIFVTAMTDVKDEQYGFDIGAVDYIGKPFHPAIIRSRVKNHLNLVKMDELLKVQKESIEMLGQAGHYNDTDTGVHIWRMADFSARIAEKAEWEKEETELLRLSAPMHDTGKIGIPDNILKAPRKLTVDEWKIMRNHSEIGYGILSNGKTSLFRMAADIALQHHERWDGSGYPQGLSGKSICQAARIVAIADVFDALTMKRPYKEPWSIDRAYETIVADRGRHFDPDLVDLFVKIKDDISTIKDKWDKIEKYSDY